MFAVRVASAYQHFDDTVSVACAYQHFVDGPSADLSRQSRGVSPGPCTATSGGWVFHGTVKNPAPRPKRFQIVVDFVSHPGSTVLATTVLNFPSVAPHSTEAWSAVGAKGESGVSCVVRLAQSS